MGYSAATPIKSAKARDQMLEFMAEFYRPLNTVAEEAGLTPPTYPGFDPTLRLFRDGELSCDRGKTRIGFNFRTSAPVAGYLWGVLRWMALRVGRVRRFRSLGIDEAVPYWVYDGYESNPVLLSSQWSFQASEKAQQYLVDDLGYRPWNWLFLEKGQREDMDKAVRDELNRLATFWEQEAGE